MRRQALVAALVVLGTAAATAANQSAPLVPQLIQTMKAASLDAIAAPDPMEPGRFVAALYVPGQLLVVSAKHPSTAAIEQRIQQKMYRDVYLDLQGTPTADGKFFVQDADEDGIVDASRGEGSVDVVYRDGKTTFLFNGDAKAQKMSGADYEAALNQADADYARVLGILKLAVDSRQ